MKFKAEKNYFYILSEEWRDDVQTSIKLQSPSAFALPDIPIVPWLQF